MKKVKTSFFKSYNTILAFLLSILGFGNYSCDDLGSPVAEYGTPHALFKVKGNVKSEAASTPIPKIKVVMGQDTVVTDKFGNYQVENMEFPQDHTFLVKFEDVDGTANGEYQSRDTTIEFRDPEFTGGTDSWYRGETTKELNITLKDKNER